MTDSVIFPGVIIQMGTHEGTLGDIQGLERFAARVDRILGRPRRRPRPPVSWAPWFREAAARRRAAQDFGGHLCYRDPAFDAPP